MTDTGRAEHRLEFIMKPPYMRKIAQLLNKVTIRALGLQISSVRTAAIHKEWFDRLLYFQSFFNLLENVDGDVVECGVASGHGLAMLASLVRSGGISRHIYGFDAWSGLPAPSKEDLASTTSIARKGLFEETSPERVFATLRWYGFDDSEVSKHVTLVKGLFSKTLPNYEGRNIALLHIDADIYNSYKDALQTLWPKLSVNGIVAFDEYHEPESWPGARKAVDEFFSELPPGSVKLEKYTPYNRYYAVKTQLP